MTRRQLQCRLNQLGVTNGHEVIKLIQFYQKNPLFVNRILIAYFQLCTLHFRLQSWSQKQNMESQFCLWYTSVRRHHPLGAVYPLAFSNICARIYTNEYTPSLHPDNPVRDSCLCNITPKNRCSSRWCFWW